MGMFSLPIRSRMIMLRWPKMSSDFICIYEKIAGGLVGDRDADAAVETRI